MNVKNLGRKGVQVISLGIASLILVACETTPTAKGIKIDAAAASKADFSAYKTYYVLEVPPGENKVAPPKPFSRVVVEAAVRNELDIRSYREVTSKDAADMLVAIQFSLKDEIQYKKKTTYDTQLSSYGGYGRGYGNGYGGGYGGYGGGYGSRYSGYSYGYGYRNYYGYTSTPRTTVVAEDFRKGNMLVDLIDKKSNAVVWEAHATGEGEHEAAKIEAKVKSVVSSMFKRYPHVAAP